MARVFEISESIGAFFLQAKLRLGLQWRRGRLLLHRDQAEHRLSGGWFEQPVPSISLRYVLSCPSPIPFAQRGTLRPLQASTIRDQGAPCRRHHPPEPLCSQRSLPHPHGPRLPGPAHTQKIRINVPTDRYSLLVTPQYSHQDTHRPLTALESFCPMFTKYTNLWRFTPVSCCANTCFIDVLRRRVYLQDAV